MNAVAVEARNGDEIRINEVRGIHYKEIWATVECPKHEEHPILCNQDKVVVLGGENTKSKRTIFVVGK